MSVYNDIHSAYVLKKYKNARTMVSLLDSISKRSGKLLVQKDALMYTKWYSGPSSPLGVIHYIITLCILTHMYLHSIPTYI